ncbi:PREDICTED: junctional protein associated with coronary artery disease-like [Chrysochloris asiatica]|uniref:Junctional protein associated with coronary artery disease-like n=1 Tax=Chrysochloris asiatica TaxID=185453 RepID=A0A9B0TZ83_CHRAS|nr:PREDICTED: junctional protein associated with coronary artery disease-like [Chrysochloris asiatica]
MYSVEDLLISHGYKLSRSPQAPRKDHHEGRQREATRTRADHGMLNGYENSPAAFAQSKKALGKGCVSDPENHRGTPRSHREPQSSSAFRTSEVGFYHQPQLVWSSQPQTGNDPAYWRRSQRDREDLEVRGLAQAHSRPVHLREGPWDVGARTENVTKKAVWEEELRMAEAAKWQNVSLESWKQPRKLGRQMSDGGGEKLFHDLYPFIPGGHRSNPPNKGKSQSLPKVLFPESLSCLDTPLSLTDGHLPRFPEAPLYPPNLESTRNTEKGGFVAPFLQPKYGRPLKPPSYELHQQSRGGVENSEYQDADDLYISYLTKTSDPRQERCGSDSSLEPPVYVPPPSYHSPSPHITNPYLEDSAPRRVGGGRSQQHPPTEKAGPSCQRSPGSLETGHGFGTSPLSPRRLSQHPCSPSAYNSSVQYIPFDDPRIRHIKLSHPQGVCEETKLYDSLYSPRPAVPQEPAHKKMQPGGAFLNVQNMTPTASAISYPSPQWLAGRLPWDGESGDVADQRDSCTVQGQRADGKGAQCGHSEGRPSSPNPQAESACEIVTKLKKFETGLQPKKSSKIKKNETVFCLVSIPVKSESHLPAIDRNNNDLEKNADKKSGLPISPVLQEQSLLSMSSTDLELQALTGSMSNRTELQKQDLRVAEDTQTNDLSFIQPTGHRELKYSTSWSGHQFRDQQTQTNFTEESKRSQLLLGAKPGASGDTVLAPNYFDPATSGAPVHAALTPGDQKQRLNGHCLKSQMYLSPSSNSAFSRTPSAINQAPAPRVWPSQPHMDVHDHGASPPPKGEVVKGEPTSPCNSQQLFGQFLLKPVSRRPWDLISQLENFNRELQEQKESSGANSVCGSEESEAEGQQEDSGDSRWKQAGFSGYGQAVSGEQQPRTPMPPEPGFRSGRVKSQSDSYNEEQKVGLPAPALLQAQDSRGESFRSADGNWITEKRKQEVGARKSIVAISPDPVKRTMAFRLSDTKPVPTFSPAERREPGESQNYSPDMSVLKPSNAVTSEGESREDRETEFLLSLANKNRGLSAPDLRSVGLLMGQEPNASKLDSSSEKASAVEIPPNESLQERAERILGIEVAVESLLRASRRPEHQHWPESSESAFRPDSPREEPLTSSAQPDGPSASKDAFYGRRKCGWTESPLFVGERDMTRRSAHTSAHSGTDGAMALDASGPEPQPNPLGPESLDLKDSEKKPPFRSTLFHFMEKSPNVAGSEKRCRSTSKVIESLQEKLASPSRRVDPDRLLRMREVSSVSRMRLLSSRSSDSMEEAEELKAAERAHGEHPRSFTSLNGGDLAQRVTSTPQGILSLEDHQLLAAQNARKRGDGDFWCTGEPLSKMQSPWVVKD